MKHKIKATLLQIYHHAIHNRVDEAKNLLMRGLFHQLIVKQHITNKVLYNRAVIQVGLSAFRLGQFDLANEILTEVCQTPKLKESLAQGVSNMRQQEKTREEENEEKKRQVPTHLHINLETLDCVYMTTSMFLEIPNITVNKFVVQKHVINKNFRKLMEQYDMRGMQFLP